jgi:hypothetical protein
MINIIKISIGNLHQSREIIFQTYVSGRSSWGKTRAYSEEEFEACLKQVEKARSWLQMGWWLIQINQTRYDNSKNSEQTDSQGTNKI